MLNQKFYIKMTKIYNRKLKKSGLNSKKEKREFRKKYGKEKKYMIPFCIMNFSFIKLRNNNFCIFSEQRNLKQ